MLEFAPSPPLRQHEALTGGAHLSARTRRRQEGRASALPLPKNAAYSPAGPLNPAGSRAAALAPQPGPPAFSPPTRARRQASEEAALFGAAIKGEIHA